MARKQHETIVSPILFARRQLPVAKETKKNDRFLKCLHISVINLSQHFRKTI